MPIIFDYKNKYSLKPYKLEKNPFLKYEFYNNPLNSFVIGKLIKEKHEIYGSYFFKNNDFYSSIFNKKYDFSLSKNFENVTLLFMEKILNSMKTTIKTVSIFSKNKDERVFSLIDNLCEYSDVLYLITDDKNFFDSVNEYSMKKYGIGLLKSASKECDIVVILNTNITDFYKKGRYVINLCVGHPIFNCNLLWDFYDVKLEKIIPKGIKKAFFTEKNTLFLKLRWKIQKKSWQISKKVYNRIYSYV